MEPYVKTALSAVEQHVTSAAAVLHGRLGSAAQALDSYLLRLVPTLAGVSKERRQAAAAAATTAVVALGLLYLFSRGSGSQGGASAQAPSASASGAAAAATGSAAAAQPAGGPGAAPAATAASAAAAAAASAEAAQWAALEKSLNKFERQLLGDLVPRHELRTSFEDVGGLGSQIGEIRRLVILPLTHPHLYANTEAGQQAPGVLLYGPPGTGKTMLARAVAGSSRACFLNVNIASIQSKYFGETPKLVEAVFTLAAKVAPCVVFVDEADGLLSTRSEMDQQHVNAMKAKFLDAWDGLRTSSSGGGGGGGGGRRGGAAAAAAAPSAPAPSPPWVVVMGCTNKPWALDPAVQRRMPHTITVGLPGLEGRADILRVLLRRERVAAGGCDLEAIAAATEGYSGSDLRALVRAAVLITIEEAYEREVAGGEGAPKETPRQLRTLDLCVALESVKPTGSAAARYLKEQYKNTAAFKDRQQVGGGGGGGGQGGQGGQGGRGMRSPPPRAQGAAVADSPYVPTGSMRLNSAQLAGVVEKKAGL